MSAVFSFVSLSLLVHSYTVRDVVIVVCVDCRKQTVKRCHRAMKG